MVKADPKPADTSLFVICNDAPTKRTIGPGKYGELFSKMKPGQALKVPASDASKVATAMSKWAKDHRQDCVVKHTRLYPGDSSKTPGRVWLLPKDGA